jgi:hypothetical protein
MNDVLERSSSGQIKALFWHLAAGTEKSHKTPLEISWCPNQDMKRALPELMSRALPLCQPARYGI